MYKGGYVRIGSVIIFHTSKLWQAKFFILCGVIFSGQAAGEIWNRSRLLGVGGVKRQLLLLLCKVVRFPGSVLGREATILAKIMWDKLAECTASTIDQFFTWKQTCFGPNSTFPPLPDAMLFVRKGLPKSRPTLHRGEGGRSKNHHWRIIETKTRIWTFWEFRYRVVWFPLKNHYLD